MTGLVTVAPPKVNTASATLLLISGFTARVTNSSFVDGRGDFERVAEFLVLEPAEDGLRGLLVEVQLRHGLEPRNLDFRFLVVGGDDAWVCQEFGVAVLVQEAQRG
jgi:hypothetical protein